MCQSVCGQPLSGDLESPGRRTDSVQEECRFQKRNDEHKERGNQLLDGDVHFCFIPGDTEGCGAVRTRGVMLRCVYGFITAQLK